MRVNVAIPEAQVTKPVLDAALESVTRLNEQLIESGQPTFEQALHGQGIQWKPEPPGAEHFDHAGIVSARGWGDCDDLAPWQAASLRVTGKDPGATAEVVRSGPHTWHAIVKRSDGSIDDPSKAAGMGTNGHGVHGAVLPLMNPPAAVVGGTYIVRPGLAIRPSSRGYQARVDLPWHWREHLDDPPTPTDYAMTALHTAPVAATALVGALDGAIQLGEAGGFADPEHLDRLEAIADACEGADYQDLLELYGPQHAQAAMQLVGSFFGDAFKAVKSVVTSPVTSAVRFVKDPSLSNFARTFTDPITSQTAFIPNVIKRGAAPIAATLAPMARMVPGPWGAFAGAGLDYVSRGMPTDPRVLAEIAARNATAFIPGGGMLSQAMPYAQQFMQRGPAPQQQAPQGHSLYEQMLAQAHARQQQMRQQQGPTPIPWPRHFA